MEPVAIDIERLHLGFCGVQFEKTNGELREMRCTLNSEYIDKHCTYVKKTERTKAPRDNVMSVFDCDKNEWRSIRPSMVTNFEYYGPYTIWTELAS